MSLRTLSLSILTALTLSVSGFSAHAGMIMVNDPYVRSTSPASPTGAAFMMLMNHSENDDRLIDARSDIAAKVEIHTHIADGNGVMRMTRIEGGIELPAGAMHMLQRGGDHIMFMGLKQDLVQGEMVSVILVFENAGEVTVDLPVDRERAPGQMHKHGTN